MADPGGHAHANTHTKYRCSLHLSHKAAGNKLNICSNVSVSLSTNLAFFKHDLQGLNVRGLVQKPYIDDNLNTCLQVLERHYNQVGLEIKQGWRKLELYNVETAEMLASEFDIQCPLIKQWPLNFNELKIGDKKVKTLVGVTRSRSILWEAVWLSCQRVGLAIRRSRFESRSVHRLDLFPVVPRSNSPPLL